MYIIVRKTKSSFSSFTLFSKTVIIKDKSSRFKIDSDLLTSLINHPDNTIMGGGGRRVGEDVDKCLLMLKALAWECLPPHGQEPA